MTSPLDRARAVTNAWKPKALPDQAYLQRVFEYRDGALYWKERTARMVWIGARAGHAVRDGYWSVCIQYANYFEHRLIFQMHHGWCPQNLDHIDGNPANNRIENLRPADIALNAANRRNLSSNTSGRKGVYWSRKAKRWHASIGYQNKRIFLGAFTDIDAAADAYDAAAVRYFGQHACTNRQLREAALFGEGKK
jgi:HNH endonuclease